MRLQPFERIVKADTYETTKSNSHSTQSSGKLGGLFNNSNGIGDLKNLLPLVETLKNSSFFNKQQNGENNTNKWQAQSEPKNSNVEPFSKADIQQNQSKQQFETNANNSNPNTMFPLDNNQLALSNFLKNTKFQAKKNDRADNGQKELLSNNKNALLSQMRLHQEMKSYLKNK